MNTTHFFAQDPAGNTHRLHVVGHARHADVAQAARPAKTYALDDGSQVKRIDNDTFLVVGTGAYITVVRD
jgi:hypothetical protein